MSAATDEAADSCELRFRTSVRSAEMVSSCLRIVERFVAASRSASAYGACEEITGGDKGLSCGGGWWCWSDDVAFWDLVHGIVCGVARGDSGRTRRFASDAIRSSFTGGGPGALGTSALGSFGALVDAGGTFAGGSGPRACGCFGAASSPSGTGPAQGREQGGRQAQCAKKGTETIADLNSWNPLSQLVASQGRQV